MRADSAPGEASQSKPSLAKMRTRIVGAEAVNAATSEMLGGDSLEDRFALLEREEQIDALLKDLKEQHSARA